MYKKFNSSKHDLNVGDSVKIGRRVGVIKNYEWPTRVLVELPMNQRDQKLTGCYSEQAWYSTSEIKIQS